MQYRPRVLCLCRWCSNAFGELRGHSLPLSHALFRAFSTFLLCLPRRHFSMVVSRWGCPGVFAWVPSYFLFVGGLLQPIFLKDYSAACAQPMASMLANICWCLLACFCLHSKGSFFFFWFFGCPFLCILLVGLHPVDFSPSCHVVRQILECVQHIRK